MRRSGWEGRKRGREDKGELSMPKSARDRGKPVLEYRSKREIFGMPLVHIHLAQNGRPCLARGILAIGNVAVGGVAIGGVSFGAFALGGLAAGAAALGGLALGYLALGGLALGGYAIGGLACGLHALGGGAFAAGFAAGDMAKGTIALGEDAAGQFAMRAGQGADAEALRALVLEKYPRIWRWFLELQLYLAR
mgnify:CR=1 FL=1